MFIHEIPVADIVRFQGLLQDEAEILMGSLQTDVETAYRLAEQEMLRRSTVVLAVKESQGTTENMGLTVLSLEKYNPQDLTGNA